MQTYTHYSIKISPVVNKTIAHNLLEQQITFLEVRYELLKNFITLI